MANFELEADKVAERIRKSDNWNPQDLEELCYIACLGEEWEEADGESFENVVYKAARILDVEI